MDYSQVLLFLDTLKGKKYNLDLKAIQQLLVKLGNPEKKLKCIHVAGTNGKGSTCVMISSILSQAGYRVGMYISPHLFDFRERISIDGRKISRSDLVRCFEQVKNVYGNETYFEVVVAMAFLYFLEKQVDYVVLEVGLGGRLDATNVVDALVSVITNVSVEHSRHLGKTLSKIAYEKAGIIKENGFVVSGCRGAALSVIKRECKKKNAQLTIAQKFRGPLSLKGEFQLANAAVALSTIHVLVHEYNLRVSAQHITNGLAQTRWPGRFQFLSKNLLVDCAHNPAGMLALSKEIKRLRQEYDRIILVIGILEDKEYKKMMSYILPTVDYTILTEVSGSRSLAAEKLAYGTHEIVREPLEAVRKAKELASENDLVVVSGSLYLIGEILPKSI